MSSYIRVRYLRSDGRNAPTFDSCVLSLSSIGQDTYYAPSIVGLFLTHGFAVPTTPHRSPDPEEIIMPAAIMSVTPCDERGWSNYDREKHHESIGHKKEW